MPDALYLADWHIRTLAVRAARDCTHRSSREVLQSVLCNLPGKHSVSNSVGDYGCCVMATADVSMIVCCRQERKCGSSEGVTCTWQLQLSVLPFTPHAIVMSYLCALTQAVTAAGECALCCLHRCLA